MSAARPDDGLVLRRATAADRPAVIALLAASLGRDDDPRYEDLYAWKHEENAFGPSPAWVACDGDRLAGLRVLMRWEFRLGAEIRRAVRAVDTATHPDYQGRGIFTRLTRQAIDELRDEGVHFVFNTPNDQSRPGYLKMGWEVVGRLPTSIRPIGVGGLVKVATARVPAERWSSPSTAGEDAAAVLADGAGLEALLGSLAPARGLRTALSAEFLRWRYGTPLLGYRAVVSPRGIAGGVALFRIRRRGEAREAALTEVLAPDHRAEAALVRAVAHTADADYVLRLGGPPLGPAGLVRLPRQGPLLTWRAVADPAKPVRWDLTLGDIELF